MLADEDGELYCTSKMLCTALSINEKALQATYLRHKDEFSSTSAANCSAKEFLLANKVEFGISRVRDDMRLWNEDDMLIFAILSKSTVSKEFRSHLRKFIKENARRGYVTAEEHKALAERMSVLEDLVLHAQPALTNAASAAGAALAAQKGTRNLRLVK
jgi:hypothetical protein